MFFYVLCFVAFPKFAATKPNIKKHQSLLVSPPRSQRHELLLLLSLVDARCQKEGEGKGEEKAIPSPPFSLPEAFPTRSCSRGPPASSAAHSSISLHDVHQSAWRRLYYSDNDQALITLTGFDHATFSYLLRLFQPIFDNYTPFGKGGRIEKMSPRGRKRSVAALDILGLVLAWTRTRGGIFSLQLHFGLTMSNLSTYLRFGCRILVEVLKNNPLDRKSTRLNSSHRT